MSIIMLCSKWAFLYMNLPSGFDTTPDTYCLLLNGCTYGLRESSRVIFMLRWSLYASWLQFSSNCSYLRASRFCFAYVADNIPNHKSSLFLIPISAFTNGFWLYFDGYIKCWNSLSLHCLWAQGLQYGSDNVWCRGRAVHHHWTRG